MEKIDFRKSLKALYAPTNRAFALVDVPEMRFVMVDGKGDPNKAADYERGLNWVYSVSYALKFASKADLGRDYVVPPLEALWWSDDMTDFVKGNKDEWRWTQMVMVPDFITGGMIAAGIAQARGKLGEPPASLRVENLAEGKCLQALHIGSYADEAPLLADLHDRLMPEMGLTFAGHHHEIYLSDPRRVEPAKLKTILRQPVKPVSQ